jgi:hypothetical protein
MKPPEHGSSAKCSRYLINNGIDNLWIQNSLDETPANTTRFSMDEPSFSVVDASLSSPRIILCPGEDNPTSMGVNIYFQFRVESGTFTSYGTSLGERKILDMSGWKIAYATLLSPEPLDTDSATYKSLKARSPAIGSYNVNSLLMRFPVADNVNFYQKPVQAYTNYGTNNAAIATSQQLKNDLALFCGKKLSELNDSDLLIAGYTTTTTSLGQSEFHSPATQRYAFAACLSCFCLTDLR